MKKIIKTINVYIFCGGFFAIKPLKLQHFLNLFLEKMSVVYKIKVKLLVNKNKNAVL